MCRQSHIYECPKMAASFCMMCGAKLLVALKFRVCLNRACSALKLGGAALNAKFSHEGKPLQCYGCSNFLEDTEGDFLQCPAASEKMQFYRCTDKYTYGGNVIDAEAPN